MFDSAPDTWFEKFENWERKRIPDIKWWDHIQRKGIEQPNHVSGKLNYFWLCLVFQKKNSRT